MKIKKKITTGFVIQTFVEEDDGGHTCTEQEFIAGGQVDFEDEQGEPIKSWPEYHVFDMVQPVINIPVIGTLREDGQVDFKEQHDGWEQHDG